MLNFITYQKHNFTDGTICYNFSISVNKIVYKMTSIYSANYFSFLNLPFMSPSMILQCILQFWYYFVE